MIEHSFSEVFASALGGAPTVVVGLGDVPMSLPVHHWSRTADASDHALLALCDGPTLDVGCGPGRLTEALASGGRVVVELGEPGTAVVSCWAALEASDRRSRPFRWAAVLTEARR